jgi:flagellar motor switch protein FliN/FliY
VSEQDDMSAWGEALAEQEESEKSTAVESDDANELDAWSEALDEQESSEAEAASFESLVEEVQGDKSKVDLDVLLDVPVTLQLEIGRAQVSIRNLLSYTQGSVVEMDRLAGEPLDLLVNGTLIAHGEVVVINDKFGVRLTDVVSPQERIKKLR